MSINKTNEFISKRQSVIKSGKKSSNNLLKSVLKKCTEESTRNVVQVTRHSLNIPHFAARVVAYVDCYVKTYLSGEELDDYDRTEALTLTRLLEAIEPVAGNCFRPEVAMDADKRGKFRPFVDHFINSLYDTANDLNGLVANPSPDVPIIMSAVQQYRDTLPNFYVHLDTDE